MGPEERRLRLSVDPAVRGQVEAARAAWQDGADRLHDVAQALSHAIPLARQTLGSETSRGAVAAFRAMHDSVNERVTQMREGARALERAAAAIEAAEKVRDGFDTHPLDRPVEPRWSEDPLVKLAQEARHGLAVAAYDIEYSMRERAAARAAAHLDTTFRDSSEAMREVQGERPAPAAAPGPQTTGTGGSSPRSAAPPVVRSPGFHQPVRHPDSPAPTPAPTWHSGSHPDPGSRDPGTDPPPPISTEPLPVDTSGGTTGGSTGGIGTGTPAGTTGPSAPVLGSASPTAGSVGIGATAAASGPPGGSSALAVGGAAGLGALSLGGAVRGGVPGSAASEPVTLGGSSRSAGSSGTLARSSGSGTQGGSTRSGAGAGGRGSGSRDDRKKRRDHLWLDEDWGDDEGSGPGVLR